MFLHAVEAEYAKLPDANAPHHRFMAEALKYGEAYQQNDYDSARRYLEQALAVKQSVVFSSGFRQQQGIRRVLCVRVSEITYQRRTEAAAPAYFETSAMRATSVPGAWHVWHVSFVCARDEGSSFHCCARFAYGVSGMSVRIRSR